jgi:pilus assembly protein CpaE
MHITILSHNPTVCSLLSNSLGAMRISHGAYSTMDGSTLRAEMARTGPSVHLVVLDVSVAEADDAAAIAQLRKLGGDQFRVVATGGPLDSEGMLKLIRAGAFDYLDITRDISEQFAQLQARVHAAEFGCKTKSPVFLPVISPAGGCGSTFLSANLACALASLGCNVCALDLKPSGGDLAAMLKLKPRHTLHSLASQGEQIDVSMLEQCLVRHDSGVNLLASPEPFTEIACQSGPFLRRIVQTAGQMFSHVLYEIEDCQTQEAFSLLNLGERILIPLRLDYITVSRTRRCLDFLAQSDVSRDRILLLANRVGRPKDLPISKVEEVLGFSIEHQIPEDSGLANMSLNIGTPLALSHPQSSVSRQLFGLAKAIARRGDAAHDRVPRPNWWKSLNKLVTMFGR